MERTTCGGTLALYDRGPNDFVSSAFKVGFNVPCPGCVDCTPKAVVTQEEEHEVMMLGEIRSIIVESMMADDPARDVVVARTYVGERGISYFVYDKNGDVCFCERIRFGVGRQERRWRASDVARRQDAKVKEVWGGT